MLKDDYKAFISQSPLPTKIDEGIFFLDQIKSKGIKRKDIISAVSVIRKIQRDIAKKYINDAMSTVKKVVHQFDGKLIEEDKKVKVPKQEKEIIVESVEKIIDKTKEGLAIVKNDEVNAAKLAELAMQIRDYAEQVRDNIINIGNCFIQAKAQVKHGEWNNWVEKNTAFTRQTAHKFMQCAKRFKDVAPARQLNSTQMMELLALPAPETEEFFETNAMSGTPVKDMTKTKLRVAIKKWKESHPAGTKPSKHKKKILEVEETKQESATSEKLSQFKIIEIKIRADDEAEFVSLLNDVLQAKNKLSVESMNAIYDVIGQLMRSF